MDEICMKNMSYNINTRVYRHAQLLDNEYFVKSIPIMRA